MLGEDLALAHRSISSTDVQASANSRRRPTGGLPMRDGETDSLSREH